MFWGGYSGYFADPDGHVWELAMNPFWPLSPDGTLTLPRRVTLGGGQLLAYAGALALLVATPGPVVAALIARAATGGVRGAVPLAAGVAVGDVVWPLFAMLGIGVVGGRLGRTS